MEMGDSFQEARERMVRDQMERRGIRNFRLLDIIRSLPRHRFVDPSLYDRAYEDYPLPIGEDQTISQPYMVAVMTDLLNLQGHETVLEIGTGSGYQAAVLGAIARLVHTVERLPALANQAMRVLGDLGYSNVFVHVGDGSEGWPQGAPYHAILVTAAAPEIPGSLMEQLGEGGTLVIPVGGRRSQELERWRKLNGQMHRENIFPVAFVPLRGRYGWQDAEWKS